MQNRVNTEKLFEAFLMGTSDEVFLFDADYMELLAASEQVKRTHGSDYDHLKSFTLNKLIGIDERVLNEFIASNDCSEFLEIPRELYEKNLFTNILLLKVMTIYTEEKRYILVIKNDLLSKEAVMHALDESESRFQALVTNTPGLVCQFQIDNALQIEFSYLSDGCKALLGISPEELRHSPKLFSAMINIEDHENLIRFIESSLNEMKMLNWEGRVWIEEWQDTKWINLRAIPRMALPGVVQWEGIMTNITQSKKEKIEIEQSRQRLAELSAHMNQIKEKERHRIAREIHDDLGGNLTAIKIGLSSIIKRIPEDQRILIEKARDLESIVDSTFEAAHRISSDLRPNILELGIVAALEWQSHQFEKQMGIHCVFESSESELELDMDKSITLFRICQESMSNIAKYAKATDVTVSLNVSGDTVSLEIMDNGVGIKAGDILKPNSFGLRGMAERVSALNGTFSVEKGHKHGTKVVVRIPFVHEHEY